MPTCPSCGGDYNRRKRGRCPGCNAKVEIYRTRDGETHWVTNAPSTKALVARLEQHIKRTYPYFSFGNFSDKSYMRELAIAKSLLNKCELRQDLAELVIDIYFLGFNLVPPKSMAGVIGKQFRLALAIARQRIEHQETMDRAAERRAESVEENGITVQYSL